MFKLEDIKMLKEMRLQANLTQKELARRSETSQSTIAKIESGKFEPSMRTTRRILKVLSDLAKKNRKTAKEIMHKQVLSFLPSLPLNEAIDMMQKNAYSQVPVIEGIRVLGTVTESSIISKSMGKDVSKLQVSDVMIESLPILPAHAGDEEILMLLKYHPGILILSQGYVLGIITKADIMYYLLKNKDN